MDRLNVKTNFEGYEIDVEFTDGVNFLTSKAGKGKSLLLKALQQYCFLNRIKSLYLDWSVVHFSVDQIIKNCEGKEVVLLDSADLYLTDELLERLRELTDTVVIIEMKDMNKVDVENTTLCFLQCKDNILTLK